MKISDGIVCEFVDPLVLQPASLDVATIKKKPEEDLMPSHPSANLYDGIDLWIQVMETCELSNEMLIGLLFLIHFQ